MALLALTTSAQSLRFFKYGQEVLTLNMANIDSLTLLSEEEHPARPYITSTLLSTTPVAADSWTAYVDVDAAYASPQWAISNENFELGADELWSLTWRDTPTDSPLQITNLMSQSTYYLYLKITKEGIPFYDKKRIDTDYSFLDACYEYKIALIANIEGYQIAYTAYSLEAFFLANSDYLGSYNLASQSLNADIYEYIQTLKFSQLATSNVIVYKGGTLYLQESIPADAINYIKQKYDQRMVLSMAGYELPFSNGRETMNVDSTACNAEWNAPWEKYLTVKSISTISQAQITYTTPILPAGQKYDLYITMAAEELPLWFSVAYQEMGENGRYGATTYYNNPSPVTADSDVPNADIILKQGNNQRCFPTGTDGSYRILVQRSIAPAYTSPMKITITSFGPSSSAYRETIYTRYLRLAGIELVPSESGE